MIKTVLFDAYGTLYDVHSVMGKCDELYPGKGAQISQQFSGRNRALFYQWECGTSWSVYNSIRCIFTNNSYSCFLGDFEYNSKACF